MNLSNLASWWAGISTTEMIWLSVGFGAQAMFSMRFLLQWLASEKARRSVVPETFWYFSFAGGFMLLIYAIYRMDPVFIFGQVSGLFIYARNIHFILLARRENTPLVQPSYKPAGE
jgi:lipid-A-disaccharide synthase-like uncharacterized protein